MKLSELRRNFLIFQAATPKSLFDAFKQTVLHMPAQPKVITDIERFLTRYIGTEDCDFNWNELFELGTILFDGTYVLNEREYQFVRSLRTKLWDRKQPVSPGAEQELIASQIYKVFAQFRRVNLLSSPYCETVIESDHPTQMGSALLELQEQGVLNNVSILFMRSRKRKPETSKQILMQLHRAHQLRVSTLNFFNILDEQLIKQQSEGFMTDMITLESESLLKSDTMRGMLKAHPFTREYVKLLVKLKLANVLTPACDAAMRDVILTSLESRLSPPDKANFVTAVITLWQHQALYGVAAINALRDSLNPDMVVDAMVSLQSLGMAPDEIIRLTAQGQVPFYYKEPLARLETMHLEPAFNAACLKIIFKQKINTEIIIDCIAILSKSSIFSVPLLNFLERVKRVSGELKQQLQLLEQHDMLKEPFVHFVLTRKDAASSSLLVLIDKAGCFNVQVLNELLEFKGSLHSLYKRLSSMERMTHLTNASILEEIHKLDGRNNDITLGELNSIFRPAPSPMAHRKEMEATANMKRVN